MGSVWNLKDLYKGINDPQIEKDKRLVTKLVREVIKKYKGRLNSSKVTSKLLSQAIKDVEKLEEKLYIYLNFAQYLHSQDTVSPKIGAFYQEAQEFATEVSTKLLWLTLEIQALPEKEARKLINSPTLRIYNTYLTHLRVFSPFRKSLAEEEIITKLTQTGREAFVRLYDEKFASEEFSINNKKYTYPEISSILKDDPRVKLREKAARALTDVYKANAKFYSFTLNTLLLEKKTLDLIRGYKYPQQATFLSYNVEPKIANSLIGTVKKNYSLSEKYYKAKSKLLGRKLHEWDRYSSIYHDKKEKLISWGEARKIIFESFSKFDKEFAQIADKFFKNGWIDSEVSQTKRSGAYCSYCVPSKHPYILMSYVGTVDDVMTLAHELGHGIHAYMSRNNALVNFWPSTATAEIASVFCEAIVFDYLYEHARTKNEKINLLANKIQGAFATIFRQTIFYIFETKVHTHRRERGELSIDDLNNYFQTETQKMFGKGLNLTELHKYWWMPILHFYHYNFYVFTYAFGEALTLALYQNYKKEGQKFVDNYKKALRAGGSLTPKEITSQMGIDISDPAFWQKGINLLKNYVDEFEDLIQ